MDKVADA
ncbi:unnamed protein product, partial [Didymodactylos carnosus]